MNRIPFGVVTATGILSMKLTGVVRYFAIRRNLLDVPNLRSSHTSPTPRGGGIAIVLSFFASIATLAVFEDVETRLLITVLMGGGAMAFIGFIDDHRSLRASVRLGVHLAAAICAVILLGGIPERALEHWGLHGALIGGVMGVLALVWASNLFNFMDGIDGIAGSEAVFVTAAGAWLNWCRGDDAGLTAAMLCIAAASLGFLRWNWPPAEIFMGDVGSGFLGFIVAVLSLAASQRGPLPFEVWGILGGVFVVDATITLLRRFVRGDRWYEAHSTHAYQRLARRWQAHLPVTLLVSAINLFWLLPWAWVAASTPLYARYCLAGALTPLIALIFFPSAAEEKA